MTQEPHVEASQALAAEAEDGEIGALAEHFIEDQPSLQTPMGIVMTAAMAVIAIALCGAVIFYFFRR